MGSHASHPGAFPCDLRQDYDIMRRLVRREAEAETSSDP
jgi:hypothetical protein